MAELSESDSSNTLPDRIMAITDGASLGDIDTARSLPTSSNCGTTEFRTTMRPIQARMIGTANRRIHLAKAALCGCSAGTTRSTVGVLTSPQVLTFSGHARHAAAIYLDSFTRRRGVRGRVVTLVLPGAVGATFGDAAHRVEEDVDLLGRCCRTPATDARSPPARSRRRIGCAQWCPARTAMPSWFSASPTSIGSVARPARTTARWPCPARCRSGAAR